MHFGCPLSAVQHTAPVHDSSDMFCNDGRRQKHCCVEQGSSRFHRPLRRPVDWRIDRPDAACGSIARFAATTAQASITDYPRSCCVRAPSDQVMPVACMCRSRSSPGPGPCACADRPARPRPPRGPGSSVACAAGPHSPARSRAPAPATAMRPSDWRAPLMMHSPASSPSGTRPSPAPCAGRARRTSNAARADRDRRAVRLRSAG